MIVLVLEDGAQPIVATRTALGDMGHTVRTLPDVDAAIAEMRREPPDLVLVASPGASPRLPSISETARARPDAYTYVMALVDDRDEERVTAALDAGVDQVVSWPASEQKIAHCLRAAERMIRCERQLRERVRELRSTLERVSRAEAAPGAASSEPPESGVALILTQAWENVETVLTDLCTEYAQAKFVSVAGASLPLTALGGATISLNDVRHSLQLDLGFFGDERSLRRLASALCGGDESVVDAAVTRDVVRELANSGMGAVKAAFLPERYTFAGAIPKDAHGQDALNLLAHAEGRRLLTLHASGMNLHIVVAVRETANRKLLGAALREGMVLVGDVKSELGVLLARAGTRLTQTTAAKLAGLLPRKQIEVSCPEDAGSGVKEMRR
jgi:AmiR/NasT family two-component response regulator